ncbi:hypothetical protein ACHAXT_004188 [Thalassiosira profunda]
MGKGKKKKSRRADEDDLLLGPPPPEADDAPDWEVAVADAAPSADVEEDAAAAPDDVAAGVPSSKSKAEGKKQPKKRAVNIDLIRLEETMAEILRDYRDKPDDWLRRTLEKNMHLPKNSLRDTLEPHILEEMMERVEDRLDREYDEEMERRKRWDDLAAEMKGKTLLTKEDKARLMAGARKVGLDPDAAVAAVIESIDTRTAEDAKQRDGDELGEHDQIGCANASLGLSIVLALQPYLLKPSPGPSSLGKFMAAMRLFICSVMYTALRFILGEKARLQADNVWENQYLPVIEAQRLEQEKEFDRKMLLGNMHLWSNEQKCWIKKGEAYQDDIDAKSAPPTIRWNHTAQQWERWSKNLTTRTKALKEAEASGRMMSFTRGTFVPVRVGDGWATAPEQPEVENKQLDTGCIRFFACLPVEDENSLEVVDVTAWATKTLVSKDAARELEAVDSGKVLFSLDLSTLLANKRGGKKGGKGGKKSKQKKPVCPDDTGEDVEDVYTVERKGVGCTARINKKYLDQL